jgi:peptidoglycan hydrolase-like protein with peptidoglycan-binding domain
VVAALTRNWYGTSNYSGGGSKSILVIHTMEGFTGPEGAKDCAKYFQGDVGASSHVCIDNNAGRICEGVKRDKGAWTQCNENGRSISVEQSGYASWSKSYWLDTRHNQLDNIARWLAEESRATGIPLVESTSRGVTYHSRLGSYGCGHGDPGSGWPLQEVLGWAKNYLGGGTTPPSSGGGQAPPLHVDYFGTDHNSTCSDVQPWQQKMKDRGWYEMLVDGDYGPISKDICISFQQEKGLGVDGYVGPETWNATWNLPT